MEDTHGGSTTRDDGLVGLMKQALGGADSEERGQSFDEAKMLRSVFVVRRGGGIEKLFVEALRREPVIVLVTVRGRVVLETCPICGAPFELAKCDGDCVGCRNYCLSALDLQDLEPPLPI